MSTSKHQSLEKLVSKGKTKEAITLLVDLIENLNGGPRDALLMLQNRFNNTSEQEILGVAEAAFTNIEQNRINYSFLHTLSEIKDIVQEHLSIYKPIPRLPNNRDALRAFLQSLLKQKIEILNDNDDKEGKDFIHFKGITTHGELEVMVRVLKSSDPTNIENNPHFKNILKLKHRNLIQILELNFLAYPYYIITEYIHGITLKELLTDLGPLPLHSVKRLLNTIGDVMNTLRKKKLPLAGIRPSKIFIDHELEPEISPFHLFINTDKKRLLETFKEDCYYFSPCLLYTSPSPRDQRGSRMPSSA